MWAWNWTSFYANFILTIRLLCMSLLYCTNMIWFPSCHSYESKCEWTYVAGRGHLKRFNLTTVANAANIKQVITGVMLLSYLSINADNSLPSGWWHSCVPTQHRSVYVQLCMHMCCMREFLIVCIGNRFTMPWMLQSQCSNV